MSFKDIRYSSFFAILLLQNFKNFDKIERKICKELLKNILKMLLPQQLKTPKQSKQTTSMSFHNKNIQHNRKHL